jgi:hypothetical protein
VTTATAKTGRVTKLADVKGVMSYRFVPRGWVAPLPNQMWFEFDPVKHVDEYEKQRLDILARVDRIRAFNGETWDFTATWFKNFFEPVYTARIDFDPVERPVLVVVGGM